MTDEAQGLAQWCREQGRSKAWAPETLDIFNAIASLLEREAPRPREAHPMIRGSLQEKLAMAEALLIKHLDELTEAERQLDAFKRARSSPKDIMALVDAYGVACREGVEWDVARAALDKALLEREAPRPREAVVRMALLAYFDAAWKHESSAQLDTLREAVVSAALAGVEREAPKDAPK